MNINQQQPYIHLFRKFIFDFPALNILFFIHLIFSP